MSQTEVQLIKADAVQTADIANSAVTDAKIAALTSSKLTGALPAISGASLTNLPAGGKVLQIKSENFTSQFAYNSSSGTSFVATNITVDITPTSASSKIYVRADFNIWKSGSSAQVNSTIYRDSTNLGGSFYGFGEYAVNAAYAVQWNMAYNDSPNTTSQITYKVYTRVNSGHHLNMGVNNVPTNITAVEYST